MKNNISGSGPSPKKYGHWFMITETYPSKKMVREAKKVLVESIKATMEHERCRFMGLKILFKPYDYSYDEDTGGEGGIQQCQLDGDQGR